MQHLSETTQIGLSHWQDSVLFLKPNFEPADALRQKINWLRTWKIGSQLEPKNCCLSHDVVRGCVVL